MARLFLILALLFPSAAFALRVDNCDDTPHRVTVRYSGEEQILDLPPGQGRYIAGIPLELQVGTDLHRMVDYDDEWCVWGKNDIHIQKRHTHRRGR